MCGWKRQTGVGNVRGIIVMKDKRFASIGNLHQLHEILGTLESDNINVYCTSRILSGLAGYAYSAGHESQEAPRGRTCPFKVSLQSTSDDRDNGS